MTKKKRKVHRPRHSPIAKLDYVAQIAFNMTQAEYRRMLYEYSSEGVLPDDFPEHANREAFLVHAEKWKYTKKDFEWMEDMSPAELQAWAKEDRDSGNKKGVMESEEWMMRLHAARATKKLMRLGTGTTRDDSALAPKTRGEFDGQHVLVEALVMQTMVRYAQVIICEALGILPSYEEALRFYLDSTPVPTS